TAYWPRGPIRAWDTNINDWERGWGQANSDVIILKRIKNSNKVTTDFLKEVYNKHQLDILFICLLFTLLTFIHSPCRLVGRIPPIQHVGFTCRALLWHLALSNH